MLSNIQVFHKILCCSCILLYFGVTHLTFLSL